MKRVYTSAPRWADYLAQILWKLQYMVDSLTPRCFGRWAVEILDRHCRCEMCLRMAEWREKYRRQFNEKVPGFCRLK